MSVEIEFDNSDIDDVSDEEEIIESSESEEEDEYVPPDESDSSESEDESENDEKEEDEEEDIQFESDDGGDNGDDYEEENDGIDPSEAYEETPKKTAKAIFNRRKRTKPPKVSKVIRKKKKNQDEEIVIQNYMVGDLREKTVKLFEKLTTEKNCKILERSIFNHLVRKTEIKIGRKLKKSDLDTDMFRTGYTGVVYEIFVTMSAPSVNILTGVESTHTPSVVKCKDMIDRLAENKTGLQSHEFRDEQFIDRQETKNIEEPPKAKPGIHQCSKCLHDKSKKDDPERGKRTWQYELQTRSQDEPMTIFVTCLDCGKKWRTS